MKNLFLSLAVVALMMSSCSNSNNSNSVKVTDITYYSGRGEIHTENGLSYCYPEEWVRGLNLNHGDEFQVPSNQVDLPNFIYFTVSISKKIHIFDYGTDSIVYELTLVPEKKYRQYLYNEKLYSRRDYNYGKEFKFAPYYGPDGGVGGLKCVEEKF